MVHPRDVNISLSAAVKDAAPAQLVMCSVFDVTLPCAAISLNNVTRLAYVISVNDTLICGDVPPHCPVPVFVSLNKFNFDTFVAVPCTSNLLILGTKVNEISSSELTLNVVKFTMLPAVDVEPNLSTLFIVFKAKQPLNIFVAFILDVIWVTGNVTVSSDIQF